MEPNRMCLAQSGLCPATTHAVQWFDRKRGECVNTLFNIEAEVPARNNNEWYTPAKYIEAARDVMGNIELDPASCAIANKTVKAERYFTKEQNGLLQEWKAHSLWLNPPYGRSAKMQGQHLSTIKLFVDKCLDAYQNGDVLQAIILATTEVNAKWFYPLWQYTICFPDHRVNFIMENLPKSGKYSQMFGTCFVYLGPHE